jgi:hypothetical protein
MCQEIRSAKILFASAQNCLDILLFVPVEYFTFVMSTLVILCKSKGNIKNWSLDHSSMGALVILLEKKLLYD